MDKIQKLYTKAGESLTGTPWNTYPRPQMVREDWMNLNGKWNLNINDKNVPVIVPFSPESLLSQVEEKVGYGDKMTYYRFFELPEEWEEKDVLIHFGAVNRIADVYINGKKALHHENGYLPFSKNITKFLRPGRNEIKVEVVNDLSTKHPWGKQKEKRGGMWYTPTSGIWQTVWLEPVSKEYIQGLKIKPGKDHVDITVEGVTEGKVIFENKEYPLEDGKVRIEIDEPIYWSPENPHLYNFEVEAGEDKVSSYFALRTLEVKEIDGKKRLLLNGRPYFFNGLLDQGYWSDGLYTPATPEGFEEDIMAMKDLGFNTLRKHIKIEPEQFYYDCDRLGMIVFQDMVNNGKYHYVRDTALPTIGLQNRDDKDLQKDEETRENFLTSMDETVQLLDNHPSIVYWTIFNEGWGQFGADEAYKRLKAIDDTRFIDSTSGWFHQKDSDVDSLHIYFKKLGLGEEDLPQLLSEFGGYSYKIPEHSFNQSKTYGYRKYTDKEEFLKGLRELYEDELIPLISEGLNGSIYTQVSDVEDETNGLLTYDRKVHKILPEEFKDISEKISEEVEKI